MLLLNIKGFRSFKKIVSLAAAIVMMMTVMLSSGCSTPEIAGTVGDQEFTTAQYLAYLYYAYTMVDNQYSLSYYQANGTNIWSQTLNYGDDEETAETLPLEEYLVRITRDSILRQYVVEQMMKDKGITPDEEKLKEFEEDLKSMSEDALIRLGFNKSSYASVLKKVSINERSMFMGLFGEGGKTPMSDTEIKKYYDDNYITYKIIPYSIVDENEEDLSKDEIKAIKEKLEKYKKAYEKDKDFDAVIEQQKTDEEEEEAAATSTTGDGTATTTAQATTTTEATTTTAATTTTQASGTTTTTSANGDGSDDEDETESDPNLKFIDANRATDEALTEAVKSVEMGKAKIVEYKEGGTKKTMALILRVDPRSTEEYSLEKQEENILFSAKYDDFDKEIKEKMKTVKIEIKDAVLKKCTPIVMSQNLAKIS